MIVFGVDGTQSQFKVPEKSESYSFPFCFLIRKRGHSMWLHARFFLKNKLGFVLKK